MPFRALRALRLASLALTVAAASLAPTAAHAQRPAADSAAARPVRVFLDCETNGACDSDFFRTELTWVDWVRDRQGSDVLVLVTAIQTGSGGTRFALAFLGQARFAGRADTLEVLTAPAATADERRRALGHELELGLVRFVAATDRASRLRVVYDRPGGADAPAAAPTHDSWKQWVFETSAYGYFNGESQFKSTSAYGMTGARRTTEAWKLDFSVNGDYSESRYTIGGGQHVVARQRGNGANALAVKSIGRQWSAGLTGSARRSDYYNERLLLRVAPALEYDVFPYTDFTRRSLTFRYAAGVASYDYLVPTIFGRSRETRATHSLDVGVGARQPWGTLNFGVAGSQFLDDPATNSLTISGNADVRLFKGFSLNLGGFAARVRDQIYLPGTGATDQDVLLRRSALATNFRYFANFGVTYRFGSVLNNVVNPRFGS